MQTSSSGREHSKEYHNFKRDQGATAAKSGDELITTHLNHQNWRSLSGRHIFSIRTPTTTQYLWDSESLYHASKIRILFLDFLWAILRNSWLDSGTIYPAMPNWDGPMSLTGGSSCFKKILLYTSLCIRHLFKPPTHLRRLRIVGGFQDPLEQCSGTKVHLWLE